MSDSDAFDFWYALENTHVLRTPSRALETFGTTRVHYHLISEVMDAVDQVRVREGTLNAAQPQILTPGQSTEPPLEGFDDQQSRDFMEWLREHKPDMRFLKYGFHISKTDVNDSVLHENLQTVKGNVLQEVEGRDESFAAVLEGVDRPWEVCLLKLMVDLMEKSLPHHVSEMQQRNLLPDPHRGVREIEEEFAMAERDSSRVPYLHKRLRQRGVFEQYQDRFFELVRRTGGSSRG